MTLRCVLVVDDEQHAREDLAHLLEANGQAEEVVLAASGAEALVILQREPVDAVFLDIRMPGLDGLQLAKTLGQFASPPPVVFVSAFDGHAVEAFDVGATDYLLKPVSAERLRATIGRLEQATPPNAPGGADNDELPFVAVDHAGKTMLIERSEIRFIVAEGDYVRLHTYQEHYLVRRSLSSFADRWRTEGFVQVHRSYVVNLRHVTDISASFNQTLAARVNDAAKTTVPVSRRRAKHLRQQLGLTSR